VGSIPTPDTSSPDPCIGHLTVSDEYFAKQNILLSFAGLAMPNVNIWQCIKQSPFRTWFWTDDFLAKGEFCLRKKEIVLPSTAGVL